MHLLTFNHVLLDSTRSSNAPCTVRELQPRELLDWVNHSSQNGDVVCCSTQPWANGRASFNPDKLIGSRRGEGDPVGPPTPLSKEERWGVGCRLKNTAADAITVTAINQT